MATVTGDRHDLVVLGSSPLLLIEAWLQARAGRSVTVIDQAPQLGGAWRSMLGLGDYRVESACHVLENYRGFAAFLGEELGLPLEPMLPPPRLCDRQGNMVAYGSRRLVLRRMAHLALRLPVVAGARLLEAGTGGRWRWERVANFQLRRAVEELRRLWHHPLGQPEHSHHYPRGGADGMVRWLVNNLLDHGGRVVNTKVTGLELDATGPVAVQTAAGTLLADEVLSTEALALPQLRCGSHRHALDIVTTTYPHVLAEVDGCPTATCSYVHLPRDAQLVRFADVTGGGNNMQLPAGRRLVLFELRACVNATGEELVRRAKALGALPATARCLRAEVNMLSIARSTPSPGALIPAAWRPRCRLLRSTGDLAAAILRERTRWRQLLQRAPARPAPQEPTVVLPMPPTTRDAAAASEVASRGDHR